MQQLLSSLPLDPETLRWLVALAYAVAGYVGGKLLSVVITGVLKRLAAKTKNRVDDIILAVTEKPLVFIVFVAGLWFGIDSLDLDVSVTHWVDKVFYVLVTFAVAWILVRLIDGIINEYLAPFVAKSESSLDDQLLPIIRKVVKVLIWILATLVGLNNAGYDVGALLAGLGIGGVAVALAAKDTLSNLFGSIAVFIDRSFAVNDRIKVAGFDGTVTEIGLRTSRLRTLDNRVITIPNAIFGTNPIENVSSEPSTKVGQVLELSLDNDAGAVEKGLDILRTVASGFGTSLDEGTIAAFSGFGEGTFRLSFIVFLKKGADYFATLSALNLAVLKAFKEAGIEFARPARLGGGPR
ncbi:MAG TPA: mechanosensitive ion channel family protein [Rectinemataceae bacterium]|nr:mechanosensitive ion channel family protein [Rectinemataceae bacterium]